MYERVVKVLGEFVEDCEITEDSTLVDDLGLSSLDVINIVSAFEDEFGIEVPDRVIPTFRTVSDITDYIEKNAE